MLAETIERWNEMVRAFVWGAPMLVLLIGTGVYFTAKTHLFQLRHMGLWLRKPLFSCFTGEARRKSSGGVSPFGVMCTALAATVGTGNIAGVATALTIGGPGAVFWMWISAFFGMMTAFAENTLGMLYRERGKDGAWRGGPMMYLKKGLHSPFLAGAFALFCVLASFGIGNMSQCNSIAGGLRGVFGVPPQVTGLVTAVLLGAVLLGGLGRISRVTESLVPFMALFYMGGALFVLWCFRANLPQACGQILSAAFDWRAGVGGAAGYGMMQAIRIGVSRGVFSNEAGLGSSVMVHAAADAKEPCEQGMWAVFEVFFDTIVMCTVTGLVLLVSGVWNGGADGAAMTLSAFSTVFGGWGKSILAVSIFFFALSTLIGWSFFGLECVSYLCGEKGKGIYLALFFGMTVVGCLGELADIWRIADICNELLAIPNLLCLFLLRKQVISLTGTYLSDKLRKKH